MQGFDLSTISDAYVGGAQVSAIYYNNINYDIPNLIWPILSSPSEYADKYFTIESLEDDNDICFMWSGTYAQENRKLYWTTDENPTDSSWHLHKNWYVNGQYDELITTLNKGEKILFKSKYAAWRNWDLTPTNGEAEMWSTKRIKIYGNISSLIEGKPVIKSYKAGIDFNHFFTKLKVVDASNLYINVKLGSFAAAFENCTDLIYAPSILYPDKVTSSCYIGMFRGCTSLLNAPILPATELKDNCYKQMFKGCTSLTTAPALIIKPCDVIYPPCQEMFYGCTSLNKIICLYWNELNYDNYQSVFLNWVSDVAPTGTFIKRSGANWPTGNSGIPYGWTIEDSKITVPLTIKSNQNNNDIYITNTINNFAYSLDEGQTWSILQPDTHITLNQDDIIQLVGANRINGGNKPTVDSTYGIGNIVISYSANVLGNVMSLLDGEFNNYTSGIISNNFESIQEIPHDSQFKGLFKDNVNLTLAYSDDLVLPATKLKQSCYEDMFRGCININIWPNAAAPELPATILADNCYKTMFGWTNIITAPKLPALALAYGCYNGMFWGCWNLTTPPVLPATQLNDSCYAYMFADSAITTPPQLPAANLKDYCYQYMFGGCTSLTTAPDLPATELSPVCYASMFKGCTSLTTAPTLPATQLAWGCYRQMFKNCSSLNSIKCLALDLGYSDWNSTKDWVDGVAASGTFTKAITMQNWTTGVDGIPSGWTTAIEVPPYFTIESLANSNDISYQSNVNNIFDYSIDYGVNWITWAPNTNVTLNNGDKMLIRGNNPTINSTYGIGTFNATNYFNVSGNIMSLVDGDDYETSTTINANQFRSLFNGNTYLLNANELILPITVLASYCYYQMFYGCTSLTTAPVLLATTLANSCYGNMFFRCTSLTTAPSLPASTLANWCYSSMFNGCTSLLNTPELPATTLTNYCYSYMFQGCTSLTTAPELPATTLADNCYRQMFQGCTSLTTAPSLPATTLISSCYYNMFYGCTSLVTAPELPATTLADNCYRQMLSGCTSLNYVKCLATDISANNCTASWLNNVASTGTFVKDASMQNWPSGVNGIPSGWTVQDAS